MPARTRKLIGGVLLLIFLLFYVSLMGWLGARLPEAWPLKLAFYLVAGVGWGLPILPLLSWMNRGR